MEVQAQQNIMITFNEEEALNIIASIDCLIDKFPEKFEDFKTILELKAALVKKL